LDKEQNLPFLSISEEHLTVPLVDIGKYFRKAADCGVYVDLAEAGDRCGSVLSVGALAVKKGISLYFWHRYG
jgi:hypothetical protein